MDVKTSIITANDCYKKSVWIEPKGIMLHSIGVAQPSAEVLVKNYNVSNKAVAVHAFIDANNGTVYQTLPWKMRAWHCGSSGNDTHISVEMCEPDSIQYTSEDKFIVKNEVDAIKKVTTAYKSAVDLFAYLCKEFSLNPLADGVILSHREGNLRGIASAHTDCEHLWIGTNSGYTMDKFRQDVKSALDTLENKRIYRVQVGAFYTKSYAEQMRKDLISLGYDAYII